MANRRRSQQTKRHRLLNTRQNYLPMIVIGFISGLIIASSLWFWRVLHDPGFLPFHEIRITGQLQHINAAQLRRSIQQQIHGGFFSIQLQTVKQALMTNPWVQDVAIRRAPGVLSINVQEQRPVARWNDQYLVNVNDQIFPAPADSPKGLPQLKGPDENQVMMIANFKQITNILKPLHLQVQQIVLDQRQNWEMVLDNGIQVTIGREEIVSRVQRLAHFYQQIINDHAPEVSHIDLRYANGIAVEFKKANRSNFRSTL